MQAAGNQIIAVPILGRILKKAIKTPQRTAALISNSAKITPPMMP